MVSEMTVRFPAMVPRARQEREFDGQAPVAQEAGAAFHCFQLDWRPHEVLIGEPHLIGAATPDP
jgi:hypothetical protein